MPKVFLIDTFMQIRYRKSDLIWLQVKQKYIGTTHAT